jgi:hypothetical protein
MHGIAGGVFNTVSNIGTSIGLAITAVIAASASMAQEGDGKGNIEELMKGYQAAFWTECGGFRRSKVWDEEDWKGRVEGVMIAENS